MTTYVPFAPTKATAFSFQATFDRQSYNCITLWNYFGQRYYLAVYTIQGELQYCLPLIASPDDYSINLNEAYFTTTLVFRASSQQFEIG